MSSSAAVTLFGRLQVALDRGQLSLRAEGEPLQLGVQRPELLRALIDEARTPSAGGLLGLEAVDLWLARQGLPVEVWAEGRRVLCLGKGAQGALAGRITDMVALLPPEPLASGR